MSIRASSALALAEVSGEALGDRRAAFAPHLRLPTAFPTADWGHTRIPVPTVTDRDTDGLSERSLRLKPISSQGFKNGAPDTIRTCDLCLRRATLYPAELRALTVQAG